MTGGTTRQPRDGQRHAERDAPARAGPAADGPRPPDGAPPQRPMPPRRTWLSFLLILAANFLLVRFLLPSGESPVTVPYTLFKEEIPKRNVAAIYSHGSSITGRFRTPVTYPRDTASADT